MLPAIEIGALFNLEQRCWYKSPTEKMPSEKAQVQEGWRSSSRGSKTNPNFQLVNKPSWIGPHKVLQSSLIDTVFYEE